MSDTASSQDALVTVMVTMCVADHDMANVELSSIETLIARLPVFDGFDRSRIGAIADRVAGRLQEANGLEAILDEVKSALPARLQETAYALAVEVASADVVAEQEELRFMEMLRDAFEVSRLNTAAIEHSARVRYRKA
ncbi:tellurite resistance TerB family protein [Prosthecomicrobium sp. N25]|uniref:tellurite resistance TerB family protein n=1 Tax=Prosthecomicrobium sp. N25 TaxID=3129254 RepID=UPI003077FA14